MLNQADSKLAVVERLIAEQEAIFVQRQPKSAELAARPRGVLAGGVTSNWQITQPQPVWLSHGAGAKVYDVDGNEYVDLHGGYGAALAGHAHPAIVSAVTRPGRRTAPTSRSRRENAIAVASELARRWGLPRWRFANSGTEATMDAVHLMRSFTGRDLIIKVEGGYHGHHDSVQVSVMPDPDDAGPADSPAQVPSSQRHPRARSPASRSIATSSTTWAASPGSSTSTKDQVAGMIVEPVMMNAGIIPPAARLPARACGTSCTTTARCSRSTRSRPASPSAPAASPRSRRRHPGPRLPGQVARRGSVGRRDRRHAAS